MYNPNQAPQPQMYGGGGQQMPGYNNMQMGQPQMNMNNMMNQQMMGMQGAMINNAFANMNDEFFYYNTDVDTLGAIYKPEMIQTMTAHIKPVKNPQDFPNPVKYTCSCGNTGWTLAQDKVGCTSVCWGFFLVMGFVCCLPCLIRQYKDIHHSCRMCKKPVGVYKRPCCLTDSRNPAFQLVRR